MSTSPFDYMDEEPKTRKSRDATTFVWNILSVLTLAATAIMAIIFLTIFVNPQSGFNPLPPPTMPSIVGSATPTATPKNVLPPTWTPQPTNTPLPTATVTNTPTLTPTEPPPTPSEPPPNSKII